jgi:ribosome-binding protein aMBF1 (putative translation factor)
MERPIRRSACGNQPDRQGHNRRHPQDPKRAQRAFEIGQAVRERRLAFGLSQVELASRAGMTQPALSRLEAGGVIPTIPLLERISATLDAALIVQIAPHAACPPTPCAAGARTRRRVLIY